MTDKDLGTAAGEIFAKAFTLGYETGRNYIPAGGMALTAEQVEDVEALVATANPYSAPADRLRALFPATEPASYCSKGVCSANEGHDGTCAEASGWAHDAYEDDPARAVPAEEETKAEEVCTGSGGHHLYPCVLPDGHAGVHVDRRGLRWQNVASSPVVPAPTETGPWQRIEDVPVGVPFKDREGSGLVKLADGQFGYVDNYRETSRTLAEYAPFVAAEEG